MEIRYFSSRTYCKTDDADRFEYLRLEPGENFVMRTSQCGVDSRTSNDNR
jgi:hypothetical protein